MAEVAPYRIAGDTVRAGTESRIELPVARLPSDTWLSLPLLVIHGVNPGPSIWVAAGVHGDELNGIEIIRRVREQLDPQALSGTLVAVPVVNVFGFVNGSRYLPDRRDLNRSFPGSPRGSLASRLAHLFMRTVALPCELGIDLHTGSDGRANLPQIRANLNDPRTRRLARTFGAPVMVHAPMRDGSLRAAVARAGGRALLYEAGEARRFDEDGIRVGVRGVLRVMERAGMTSGADLETIPVRESRRTRWVRAPRSGIVRLRVGLGTRVRNRDALAIVSDPYGDGARTVRAPFAGVVIGLSQDPLASQGDAIVHLAEITPRRRS